MWELDCEESWVPKNWCFWTVVLGKTLESPLDCKRSIRSILKEISPRCSLEWLMLKLKLQYFGYLMRRVDSLEKTLMLGGTGGRRRRGRQRMRWLDGITDSMDVESHWTPGFGDGQGGLACCDSWGRRESDTAGRLIWSDLIWWEGLGPGGEGDDRVWDYWMASLTRWTWVWVNSGNWWWTGRLGMLWFMGSQTGRHDWAIELNWTELQHTRLYYLLDFAQTLSTEYVM